MGKPTDSHTMAVMMPKQAKIYLRYFPGFPPRSFDTFSHLSGMPLRLQEQQKAPPAQSNTACSLLRGGSYSRGPSLVPSLLIPAIKLSKKQRLLLYRVF